MNAKQELLKAIGDKAPMKCAYISKYDSTEDYILKQNHTQEEYQSFLNSLDFEYNDGYVDYRYDGQQLDGTIWFTDGTWLEREECDGYEWWAYKKAPEIPKECQ